MMSLHPYFGIFVRLTLHQWALVVSLASCWNTWHMESWTRRLHDVRDACVAVWTERV